MSVLFAEKLTANGQAPSTLQATLASAHRDRLARIANRAKTVKPALLKTREYQPFFAPVEIVATEPETIEQWVKRQRAIPLPPKKYEPWFSIESEIEPDRVEVKYPSIDLIQRVVCKYYGIKRTDLVSSRRTANVVRPRQIAGYLCKTLTLRSYPYIGHRFGGRDHTTQLHAFRKIDGLVRIDPALAAEISELTELIQSQADRKSIPAEVE